MRIEGGCHCGNIAFTLDWDGEPEEIPARACDCSFCVKHGGVWTSSPGGQLQVRIADAGAHQEYAFGTGTARFHVCRRCGVVPVVSSEIDGSTYAVVSVNALEGIDRSRLKMTTANFGDEDVATRLQRRTRGWIAHVEFVGRTA